MSEKLQMLPENNNTKKVLQQEEVESLGFARETALSRLKFIEKRNSTREFQISNIKNLLSGYPDQKEFFKLKGDYYTSNPTRVLRDVSDIITLQVVPRSELENTLKTFEKEQSKAKSAESLLKQNPNQNIFYELDGNYYLSNPARVPGEDVGKILRVKELSKVDLEAGIESFEKGSIEGISKRIDYLIDNKTLKNDNVRKLLIELRIGLSLNDNNSDISLLLGESLGNFLHLIEKSDKEALSMGEIVTLVSCGANIFRSGISDLVGVTISYLKDITSNHIYKFGKDESFLETKIRESVETSSLGGLEKYLFTDNTIAGFKESSIEGLKGPLALTAGGLDGTLDYIQSSVDLVVMPDKVLQNIKDFILIFGNNFGETIDELAKSFESESDYKYVIGYIIGIIISFVTLPSKYGILDLPKFIMNGLKLSGNFSAKALNKVEGFLSGNIGRLVDFVSKKFPKFEETLNRGGEKLKQIRDLSDNSNTLRKGIQRQSQELAKSREALQLVNNSVKLANIFGDKITGVMSQKLSTDIAMTAYKETVLKGNGFKSSEIDVLIRDTEGEVKYNLIRVKERLLEVEKIMKTEIIPVWNKNIEYFRNGDVENMKILAKILINNMSKYDSLSKLIFEKYVLKIKI